MATHPASPAPLRALLCALALGVGAGCSCEQALVARASCEGVPGAEPGRTEPCETTTACGDHHACLVVRDRPDQRCCQFADRACSTEADCCPGQTCAADRGLCFDKVTACTADADCGPRGDRFCESYTDTYGTSRRCRLRACGPGGVCPDGQGCFQGECVAALPCDGGCAPGRGCVATLDRCQDQAAPTGRPGATCPASCAPGFLATFQDPGNLWDRCALDQVRCTCAELPPLRSTDVGRFASLAADPGGALLVSAWDGRFGDLVLLTFGLDGGRGAVEYVDGVPAGPVRYGPSGPRGGVEAPGDDVGRYSDVAVTAEGRVWLSSWDATHGDLRVATRPRDGTWTTHAVDGAEADVGRYASLALDPGGRPAIVSFQQGAGPGFDRRQCPGPPPTGPDEGLTALRYAHARTATPGGPADWVVKTVACLVVPVVTGTVRALPLGVGLFPSLAFRGDEALIAFTRRAPGPDGRVSAELWAVRIDPQDQPGTPVLLETGEDTGYFPDLQVEPRTGSLAISFHDQAAGALRVWLGPQLRAGVRSELVDPGVSAAAPGEAALVGASNALVFTDQGELLAVYQDAAQADLRLARRRGGRWALEGTLVSRGAVGFFVDAVAFRGLVYASHVTLRPRVVAGAAQVDNTVVLEQIRP